MISESRTLRALRAIIAALTDKFDYSVLVRYRVVKNTAGRVELQAVKKAGPWPDTLPVSLQPGAPGVKGVPKLAAIVLVSFVEGDPSLPVVTHFARTDDPAWLPISVELDASTSVTVGASAARTKLGNGNDISAGFLAGYPATAVGRVIRFGDTANVPGVGDVILGPPTVPVAVSKVSADGS